MVLHANRYGGMLRGAFAKSQEISLAFGKLTP